MTRNTGANPTLIVTLTPNPALDISTQVDRVRPSVKLRCGEARYDPGGGGINVARAIHLLGGSAVAIFPVGGSTGRKLIQLIENEGVDCRPVRIRRDTRQDLTVDETESGLQYRFVMPGPQLTASALARSLDILREESRRAAFVVASGSLPTGAPDDFYCRATDIARANGARMVLDSSGAALRTAVEHGGLFLIKPSLGELQALTGSRFARPADQIAAAQSIVATGRVERVVLSLGADGAAVIGKDTVLRFPAIPVAVQSTVGAGDCLVAGLVLALSRGQSLEDSMRFAMAAAAASLLRPGTQLCARADVERLIRVGIPAKEETGRHLKLVGKFHT